MHGSEQVRPRFERESDEDVGVGQVMFEGEALVGGERIFVAVQMPHEFAFAVARHTVAENVIVHASADVDRVNLHVPVMRENRGDVGDGLVEENGAPMKTPGQCKRDVKRSRQHKTEENVSTDEAHENIFHNKQISGWGGELASTLRVNAFACAACGWAVGRSIFFQRNA